MFQYFFLDGRISARVHRAFRGSRILDQKTVSLFKHPLVVGAERVSGHRVLAEAVTQVFVEQKAACFKTFEADGTLMLFKSDKGFIRHDILLQARA